MSNNLHNLIEVVEAGSWSGNWKPLLDHFQDVKQCQWFSDAYHGSVDAAIALCETLLPGWIVHLAFGGQSSAHAHVFVPRRCDSDPAKTASASHDHVSRALLLAVLRAKLMEMENE